MRNKLKIEKNYTLYKWIMFGCIALMIPIICAVINIFVNKSLVESEVKKLNDFILKNIQYNIDDRLNDMIDLSNYYLVNIGDTNTSLKSEDYEYFNEQVDNCYDLLHIAYLSNPNIETILYIPSKDYIIGSMTANKIEYIYNTLVSQGKTTLSLEQWKEELVSQNKNRFTISKNMSYVNANTESIVYTTNASYSKTIKDDYLILSMPTTFITALMSEETNAEHSVIILDQNNEMIGQYGRYIDITNIESVLPDKLTKHFELEIDGSKYIASYASSKVSKWKYITCTPENIFMKDVKRNFYSNLFVIFFGAVTGVFAMIFLQRKNYKPVQKLMEILPVQENEDIELDALLSFENKLRKLYEENIKMQKSIEKSNGFDQELALLLAIKGRKNYLTNVSTEELLGSDYKNKRFMLVTTRLDIEDVDTLIERKMDHSLLSFLIDNIVMEVIGTEYKYIKTIDDRQLIFLYIIDNENFEKWNKEYYAKYQFIDEFLQTRLDLELAITLGSVFENFENIASAYAKVEEVNERRYYTKPYGIVKVEEMSNIDFSSMERLVYYSKAFEEIAEKSDFDEAKTMCNELFEELLSSDSQYNTVMYYILSIVNYILISMDSMAKFDSHYSNTIESILTEIRKAESLSVLKNEFYNFLKLICKEVDLETDDLSLSENIKAFVKDNYADCNMNISSIADTIGLTPRYMSKIFKDQTSVNLLTYINDVRIEHAKELLKTTNKTVDQISEETGFSNVRTFRRNFQKAVGVTAISYKSS